MRRYAGSTPGDEKPLRAGRYNRRNIGSEVSNFKKRGTWLYGYFETIITSRSKEEGTSLNLARIVPDATDTDTLPDVLVIFVAPSIIEGWQVVVGWYRRARMLRHARPRPAPDDDHSYRCRAKITDCVLLPESKRVKRVPTGLGAMGKSNVCYPLEADGSPKRATWMGDIVNYVNSYNGPNLLDGDVDQEELAQEGERQLRRAKGQWVVADPKKRKALEQYGVRRAMRYFARKGFKTKNVGATECFDVHCTKGARTVSVEVKATTTDGHAVMLTSNEVALGGERALFVLHSVTMTNGKPRGGKHRVIHPWGIQRKRLKPITYLYSLPSTK